MTAAPDTAAFFERLRADTARLLKLDGVLTPSQQVRVDRAASLRLLLDQLQQRQLAGEEIDARQFVTASEALERLMGGSPDAPTSPLASGEARRKLKKLIETTLMASGDVDEAERLRVAAREDEIQVQAALPIAAPTTAPSPAEHTSQPSNVSYLPSRTADGRPPPHYLADHQRQNERWRDGAAGASFEVPSWPLPR